MLSLSKDQQTSINKYIELVLEYNKLFNLSSSKTYHDFYNLIQQSLIFSKIIDSLASEQEEPIYDIGSGNGLPGIPLSIVLKKRSFVLLERSKKRCSFLNLCILKLSLSNQVQVINKDLSLIKNQIKYAVSSALCDFKSIEKILYNSLEKDSRLFLYKGPNYKADLDKLTYFSKEKLSVFHKDINDKRVFLLKLEK